MVIVDGPTTQAGATQRRPGDQAVHVARLAGVVVPLLLIVWDMTRSPLSFDGAMNVQVAQNLAENGEYARTRPGEQEFPPEIQTSSYFLFTTALAIRAFGNSALTFQAANIVFIGVLLLAVSFASPRKPWMVAALPGAVLLGTPGLLAFSRGAYGEGAVAGLALCSFLLLARASTRSTAAVRASVMAWLLLGVAVSIKSVAVAAAVPALFLTVMAIRENRTRRLAIAAATLSALVPLAAFELYKWARLDAEYLTWWREQVDDILFQAVGQGIPAVEGRSRIEKVADHFHLLGEATGAAPEWWLLLLLTMPAVLLGVVLLSSRRLVSHVDRGMVLVISALLMYGLLYSVWWLAITSTEKAWLRRVTIGLFALVLAGILLTYLVAVLTIASYRAGDRRWPVGALAALVMAVPLAVVTLPSVTTTVRDVLSTDRSSHVALDELSEAVREMHDRGADFYGIGWWSAPVVSLYSGVPVAELNTDEFCEASTQEAVDSGQAFVIWDFYAESLGSEEPRASGVVFEPTEIRTAAGTVWQVEASPRCGEG